MVKEKKSVHRIQMTEGKHQIIKQLLQEYNIETVADIQAAHRRSRQEQRLRYLKAAWHGQRGRRARSAACQQREPPV